MSNTRDVTLAALTAASFIAAALAGGPAHPDTGLSLAVFTIQAKPGVPPAAADLLTLRLVEEMRAQTELARVRSPDETATLLSASERKILLDCATDRCAVVDAEIAGALGVTHFLVGSVFSVHGGLLVNLKVIDVRSVMEVGSLSRSLEGAGTDAVLHAAPTLVDELITQCGFPRRATAGATQLPGSAPVATSPPVPPPATAQPPVNSAAEPSNRPTILRGVGVAGLLVAAPLLVVALVGVVGGAIALSLVMVPWIPALLPEGGPSISVPRAFLGGSQQEGAVLTGGAALLGVAALLGLGGLAILPAGAALLGASMMPAG